ncbi:MAG: 50S ribosomal protein L7/L12 [Candidatus Uhrbacteria bacterium]
MADEQKTEEKVVEVPAKFKDLVESIEKLSVLDLAELVKVLEEKFGVSASAPMAIAAAPAAGGDEAAAEEQSEFNVELTACGEKKIDVIKAIRSLMEIGLKDAKDMADSAPKIIKEGVPKAIAEEWKTKLQEAGATVTLK